MTKKKSAAPRIDAATKDRLDGLRKESVWNLIAMLYHMGWADDVPDDDDPAEDVVSELAGRRVDICPDINEYCDDLRRRVENFRHSALDAWDPDERIGLE
jgi:hypothetical protein